MKIPGYIKVQLLLLMILMISSVSSTALQIKSMVENTSEENIFMLLEPLRERSENKNKSLTGRSIMDLLQN